MHSGRLLASFAYFWNLFYQDPILLDWAKFWAIWWVSFLRHQSDFIHLAPFYNFYCYDRKPSLAKRKLRLDDVIWMASIFFKTLSNYKLQCLSSQIYCTSHNSTRCTTRNFDFFLAPNSSLGLPHSCAL